MPCDEVEFVIMLSGLTHNFSANSLPAISIKNYLRCHNSLLRQMPAEKLGKSFCHLSQNYSQIIIYPVFKRFATYSQ